MTHAWTVQLYVIYSRGRDLMLRPIRLLIFAMLLLSGCSTAPEAAFTATPTGFQPAPATAAPIQYGCRHVGSRTLPDAHAGRDSRDGKPGLGRGGA